MSIPHWTGEDFVEVPEKWLWVGGLGEFQLLSGMLTRARAVASLLWVMGQLSSTFVPQGGWVGGGYAAGQQWTLHLGESHHHQRAH